MDSQSDHVRNLFSRYASGQASHAEVEELLMLLAEVENDNEILAEMQAEIMNTASQPEMELERWTVVMDGIQTRISLKNSRRFPRLWAHITAAAVIVVLMGIGLFYYSVRDKRDQPLIVVNEIPPGTDGATLTLANGRKVLINDALAGNIAIQSGVKVSKTADGQIVYEVSDSHAARLEYNTLSTARGQQTWVRLADGSLVYLNAASSLKYPTSFANLKYRSVELSGEGYFEISKDKKHPFVVRTEQQDVEVLGTHFNINAYNDEPNVKTTLLEGSVKLSAHGNYPRILRPGQQARYSGSSEISIAEVDTEEAVAWRNGFFVFDHETMETAMLKISRWYNVDIVFEQQELKKEILGGSASRSENITALLRVLSKAANVNMKAEGRRIIISKKIK